MTNLFSAAADVRTKVGRFRKNFATPNSRTRRGTRSMLWSGGSAVSRTCGRLGANLLTTQILMPEAFALMAVVFLLQAGITLLSNAGVENSIIRSRRGDDPVFLRTAFTVNLLRHGAAAVVVIITALLLMLAQEHYDFGDTIYGHPDLPLLLLISSLIFVAKAMRSTNLYLASREVRLERSSLIEIIAATFGLTTTVTMVWLTGDNMALISGPLVGAVLTAALTYRLPGPSMALMLEKSAVDELWSFGRWIMGSSALGFLRNRGDTLMTSVLLDLDQFAIYVIARLWFDAGNRCLNPVARPARGLVAETYRESKAAHARVVRLLTIAVGAAVGVGFIVYTLVMPSAIQMLYRAEYHGVAFILPALAGGILWRLSIVYIANVISHGAGRLLASVNLVATAILMIALPIGHHFFGLPGIIAAVLIAGFVPHLQLAVWHGRMMQTRPSVVWGGLVVRLALAAIAFAIAAPHIAPG